MPCRWAARIMFTTIPLLLLASTGCSKDPDAAKQEFVRSGDEFLQQQRYGEAVIQYRKALQIDGRFGEARYKLAEAFWQRGEPVEALANYVRAADLMPDSADVQLKASALLAAAGRFEDAKTRIMTLLAKEPRNARALIVLGNALAGLKDFEGAILQVEDAVRIEPNAAAYATLASFQLSRGSQPDAESAFRRALTAQPDSVDAQLSLANYLWGTGRKDEAETYFRSAVVGAPRNPLANRAMAAFLRHEGRQSEAEPFLKTAAELETAPQAPQRLALADYYLSLNRNDDAMKLLKSLSRVPESEAAATTRLAAMQYASKQTAEAHRTIDGLLKKQPANVDALLRKATFLGAERKFDEALVLAARAVKEQPENAEAHFTVGVLNAERNDRPRAIASFNEVLRLNPRAVASQLYLSRLHLAAGDADLALNAAQDASLQTSENPEVQLTLARSLIAKGQIAQAEPIVSQLMTRHGTTARVLTTAATLRGARGDWATARTLFENALQQDAGDLEALSGLVGVDVAENKRPDARARIERELAKAPGNPQLFLLAARVEMADGQLSKAEEALQKAISAGPDNLAAYSMLARILITQRKTQQAREQFEQIARLNPNAIGASTMTAILFEMEDNRLEARRRYEQILGTDSRAAVAANNLAQIYVDTGGNLDMALQLAQTAKSQLPDVPEVNDTLAWVYYQKNLPALAIPLLEEAVAREPRRAIYHMHLGLAYAKAGDKARARVALTQALKLEPNLLDAAEARKILQAS